VVSSRAPSALQRHTPARPCPVCSGHPQMPKGRGVRCAGYRLDRVVYCTREEYAGSLALDITLSPPAYKHRAFDDCDCGRSHGWEVVAAGAPLPKARKPKAATAIEERHRVYSAMLRHLPPLRDRSLADLCMVTPDESGKLMFVLENGRAFKSPSAAGSDVMGGVACNGWRFWSVEGEVPAATDAPARTEKPAKAPKSAKANGEQRAIKRVPNQKGAGEGATKFFRDGCMKAFEHPTADGTPAACPEGHPAVVKDAASVE
jgi:hypothetical protein